MACVSTSRRPPVVNEHLAFRANHFRCVNLFHLRETIRETKRTVLRICLAVVIGMPHAVFIQRRIQYLVDVLYIYNSRMEPSSLLICLLTLVRSSILHANTAVLNYYVPHPNITLRKQFPSHHTIPDCDIYRCFKHFHITRPCLRREVFLVETIVSVTFDERDV